MAQHGIEALDIIKKNEMDAVVSDIVMPEMDGIVLTRELRRLYPDLPVMVMTGYGEKYPVKPAIAAGAREFIKKPFSISEFITRFDKMMRDQRNLSQMEAKQNEMVLHLGKTPKRQGV